MADRQPDAPSRCDVDAVSDEKSTPDPTVLTMFAPPMETGDFIDRTARYTRGPEKYLQDALGPEDFKARHHLLSLPEKVDRDGYGNGAHKSHFEAHIAKLMGKPHGLFFVTGVQAQLVALRVHCERAGNRRVAWHVTSHLEDAEQSAWRELYGLERRLVGARKDELPRVAEVEELLRLPAEERPAMLLVELPCRPLGCATYSFEELEEISKACREAGVQLHCDGARLWEIEPYFRKTAGKTFSDICALFDTVYLSFYKGLSGVTGAMLLVPDEAFLKEAKMWQRRAGGNAMTLMYEVIDSERGFNENIGTFDRKWAKMQENVAAIRAATEKFRTEKWGPFAEQLDAARDVAQEKTNIRIYNNLWPKQTLDEKMKDERQQAAGDGSNRRAVEEVPDEHGRAVEWMMMSVTENIETKRIAEAFVVFCETLSNP